ncbi:DIP1984 family protein [Geitlerinema splendidum]|nr:DIP1984 family protein [Geitlerinema splendidum]
MKLAEALILRADCQKRVEQLRQRLAKSAQIQEGEMPPENPQTLLAELETAVSELTGLIQRINRTNSQTELEAGIMISDALARRDTLILKRSVYESLMNAASYSQNRYSRTEIKVLSTVNVAEIQSQIDRMARDYRELDTQIQAANWNTELLD